MLLPVLKGPGHWAVTLIDSLGGTVASTVVKTPSGQVMISQVCPGVCEGIMKVTVKQISPSSLFCIVLLRTCKHECFHHSYSHVALNRLRAKQSNLNIGLKFEDVG